MALLDLPIYTYLPQVHVLYVTLTLLPIRRYAYLAKFIVLSEEESDLRLLDLAMDGLGTTEAALVEFLCARPPARVRAAKAKWEGRHDASLIDRLDAELSGHFQVRVGVRVIRVTRLGG